MPLARLFKTRFWLASRFKKSENDGWHYGTPEPLSTYMSASTVPRREQGISDPPSCVATIPTIIATQIVEGQDEVIDPAV